jgi:predicted nucleotidyltransferase
MTGLGGIHKDSEGQSSSLDTEKGRRFDITLFSALDALEKSRASYAVIGGIAASSLGRPRSTQDIDIFVRPEDADAILEVLKEAGFRTEQTNPSWLYKAFKENVLVDIIFRSEGGFYFDDEMRGRLVRVNYHGREVPLVSPEDFVLIKCAVHKEEVPHHWHDALSVLSHAKLDWDYLLHRARKAPRRLLALLIYAQADDIWVPNNLIHKLYENVFGLAPSPPTRAPKPAFSSQAATKAAGESQQVCAQAYLAAQIREALAENPQIGALDVDIWVENQHILVRGRCQSEGHRGKILAMIREYAPLHDLRDQLKVNDWEGPGETKDIV